jgi:hypothetical protein
MIVERRSHREGAMRIAPRLLLASAVALVTSCARGPSREEALAAIRAAQPAIEQTDVIGRVWQDGPPWFSCAEVIAKFSTNADSAAVRDAVGNWKPLVVAGWIVLRDSASGPVAEPGWCTANPTSSGAQAIAAWSVAPGPTFPTGQARRGWTMVVGRKRLAMTTSPRLTGDAEASAPYLVTIAPNASGTAVGAGADTTRFVAALRKDGGGWRMVSSRPATTRSDQ